MLLSKYRNGTLEDKSKKVDPSITAEQAELKLFKKLPSKYNTDYFKFFRLAFVAYLAYLVSTLLAPFVTISPYVLCLLFDIRDMVVDSRERINTLPVILGRKNAYIISYVGLFLFLALSITHYILFRETGAFLAMLLSTIATLYMIRRSTISSSDFTYLGGIDGMMLLQGMLVLLFSLNL